MILIRKIWSNTTLGLCGLTLRIRGAPEYNANIMVSNHVSWLDILVLQSVCDIVFIAKSEVRNWPGLGFLAKLADTIFVDRTPQKITSYTRKAQRVISSGETLFFFPEGTSSDGLRVLKFHSSFFQLAIDNEAQGDNPPNKLQPISIYYKPYKIGEEADFYGWWGEMSLLSNIVKILCCSYGVVYVNFHTPIDLKKYSDRKDLASATQSVIGDYIEKCVPSSSLNE